MTEGIVGDIESSFVPLDALPWFFRRHILGHFQVKGYQTLFLVTKESLRHFDHLRFTLVHMPMKRRATE